MIISSSCRKEYYDTFIVENKTNKVVIIEGFAVKWSEKMNLASIKKEIIEIDANSKYSVIKGTGESGEPEGIFEAPHLIDSVNIYFNTERVIKYSCFELYHTCFDKRNILNYQQYYNKECGKHSCTYTYTINDDDFDTAEIIE